MDKEIIEKFDKEQLDILLNDLQDIDKFTGFKNGAFKYELGKYQASLLVNYIKKQKEVIDKAKSLNYEISHIIYEDFLEENIIGSKFLYERIKKQLSILEDKEVSE